MSEICFKNILKPPQLAMQTLPSRAWSCSELIGASAQIIQQMETPDGEVVRLQLDMLRLTEGKTAAELEAMLQELRCAASFN